MHKLMDLGFAYNALEPVIDSKTMEVHYEKHYGGYVLNLNKALEGSSLSDLSIEDLMGKVGSDSALRNNGGGVYNHNLYWSVLRPGGFNKPKGALLNQINKDFENFENLVSGMNDLAMKRFGSGWVWLVWSGSKLEVCSTANQDNPLMGEKIAGCSGEPILGIDVWEHAYYLKYQNKRADYLASIWDILNFEVVGKSFDRLR